MEEQQRLFSGRDLRRLIVPLIIEQFLAQTVGMADIIMVSGLGESAVSGVSLVDTINTLIINIFAALATGGAVVCAQYIGQKRKDLASSTAKQLFYTVTACALVLTAIGFLFRDGLLRLLFGSIEPDVMKNAQIYFTLTLAAYPFIAIYNAGAALFRSMGNSRISMLVALCVNILNIGGNALMVYGMGSGVEGVGIPTLVSRAAAAIILVVAIRKKENEICVRDLHKLEFRPKLVKKILHIGIPNGVENSMFQLGKILVLSIVSTFGTASIAANACANTIAAFEVLPGMAVSLAMVTVVGQCIGAGRPDEAIYYAKKLMLWAYAFIIVLNLPLLVTHHPPLALYGMTPETTALARELLAAHSFFSMLFWPIAFTLPNVFRAANDVRFPLIVSLCSMWAIRIGMSYVLGVVCNMGVLGVWLGMILDWVVRTPVFLWRFFSKKWIKYKADPAAEALDSAEAAEAVEAGSL